MTSLKLTIALVLASTVMCNHALTNEEIIAAHKLCEANGLKASHYSSGLGFETVKIRCRPITYCTEPKK